MIVSDRLLNPVKVFSSVLVAGALGLELWNILAGGSFFSDWKLVFYLGRLVLVSHGLEAIIAVVYAGSKGRTAKRRQSLPPVVTGIYTFFVGTVGLVELFQEGENTDG